MELQQIKPPRIVRLRSKQEITKLIQEYELSKDTTTIENFCEVHGVAIASFYVWKRHYHQGKYAGKGKFIELPHLAMQPIRASTSIFASIRSGELEIQLHQYVEPGYLKALLDKTGKP